MTDGRAATLALTNSGRDIRAVLDLGLPGRIGMAVLAAAAPPATACRHPHRAARDGVADRIAGLDAGADDYVVKPFDLERVGAPHAGRLAPPCRAASPVLRQRRATR